MRRQSGVPGPADVYRQLHAQPQTDLVQLEAHDAACSAQGGAAPWKVCLGYRRGCDFDRVPNNEGIGQDNAALRADERHIVGVVCDGVSQGFYGDLAATVLTDELIAYLWKSRTEPPDAQAFSEWLVAVEVEIGRVVCGFEVPGRVREYVREELERLRDTAGSQAVMTAFILDRESEDGLLHAYQVGDASFTVHVTPGHGLSGLDPIWNRCLHAEVSDTVVQLRCNPEGRVRSQGNSRHHLAYGRLAGAAGVVIHSDGVPRNWGATLEHLGTLDNLRADLESWARKDDVSFVAAFAPRLVKQLNLQDIESPPPIRTLPENSWGTGISSGAGGWQHALPTGPWDANQDVESPQSDSRNGRHPRPRVNILATAVLVLGLSGMSTGGYLIARRLAPANAGNQAGSGPTANGAGPTTGPAGRTAPESRDSANPLEKSTNARVDGFEPQPTAKAVNASKQKQQHSKKSRRHRA